MIKKHTLKMLAALLFTTLVSAISVAQVIYRDGNVSIIQADGWKILHGDKVVAYGDLESPYFYDMEKTFEGNYYNYTYAYTEGVYDNVPLLKADDNAPAYNILGLPADDRSRIIIRNGKKILRR